MQNSNEVDRKQMSISDVAGTMVPDPYFVSKNKHKFSSFDSQGFQLKIR